MDVGGDLIGPASARDRNFRDGIVEAASTMADVEDDTALFRRQRRRQQFSVLHDIGESACDIGSARIGMGEDVTRSQQIQNLRH